MPTKLIMLAVAQGETHGTSHAPALRGRFFGDRQVAPRLSTSGLRGTHEWTSQGISEPSAGSGSFVQSLSPKDVSVLAAGSGASSVRPSASSDSSELSRSSISALIKTSTSSVVSSCALAREHCSGLARGETRMMLHSGMDQEICCGCRTLAPLRQLVSAAGLANAVEDEDGDEDDEEGEDDSADGKLGVSRSASDTSDSLLEPVETSSSQRVPVSIIGTLRPHVGPLCNILAKVRVWPEAPAEAAAIIAAERHRGVGFSGGIAGGCGVDSRRSAGGSGG